MMTMAVLATFFVALQLFIGRLKGGKDKPAPG